MQITKDFEDAVRRWLRDHIPEFANFKIASAGKYLGWHLGLEGSQLSWIAPLAKYQARVLEIVDGHAPATVALQRYNQRAVTVLSYVAHLCNPPLK